MIMTNAEMNRRIVTIPAHRLAQAIYLVRQGLGASTIKIETGLTLKQVNAVFQKANVK